MGNNLCTNDQARSFFYEDILLRYQSQGQFKHPVIGDIQAFKNKRDQSLLHVKSYFYRDQDVIQANKQIFQSVVYDKEHVLLNIMSVNAFKDEIILVLEPSWRSLLEQIKTRAQENRHFEDSQIIDITKKLSNALAALGSYNRLRLTTIAFDKNTPRLYPKVFSEIKDNLTVFYSDPRPEGVFVAPELLQGAQSNRSDTFELGMVLLSIAMLDTLGDCYNSRKLVGSQLQGKLRVLKKARSLTIYHLIQSCLNLQPQLRPPPSKIYQGCLHKLAQEGGLQGRQLGKLSSLSELKDSKPQMKNYIAEALGLRDSSISESKYQFTSKLSKKFIYSRVE